LSWRFAIFWPPTNSRALLNATNSYNPCASRWEICGGHNNQNS